MTSVDAVYLDFGKKNQKALRKISAQEAAGHVADGHFAEGSMKPKVEAALRFLHNGGKKVIICAIDDIEAALEGRAGTAILADAA